MRYFFVAHGTCEAEGCTKPKQKATGADEDDATLRLFHDHGHDTKHALDGKIVVIRHKLDVEE